MYRLRKFIIATIICCMFMGSSVCAVDSVSMTILPNIDIATGNSYSAVLKSDGTVWTWGYNNKGQLGIGSQDNSSNPVQVSNITDVVSIAAAKDYMIVLKSDGTVWAWGNNNYGQLGNNSTTLSTVPVQVKINATDYLTNITSIDVGEAHCIALKSDGTVWTWGCNSNGRLGNGNQTHSSVAIQVTSLSSIVGIDAGGKHSLALASEGTVMSWGYNSYGQLGINSTSNSLVPVAVPSLSNITALDSGSNHSLALSSNGIVYGWGRNDYGQLGTTDYVARILEPKQLLSGAYYISAGENVSFVKLTNGRIGATGYNYYGQLGINNLYDVKLNNFYITGISDVNQISVGTKHVLALKDNGSLWGWGDNSYTSIDNTNTSKKGLPGIINNSLNDEIGDDTLNTRSLSANESVMSKINYSNDVDMFTISASSDGRMFVTVESSKNISLGRISSGVQTDISLGQKTIAYETDVSANEIIKLAVSGDDVCDYKIKYLVIPNDKVLLATASLTEDNILITGNANTNSNLFLKVYNDKNQLSDIILSSADANGDYTISYPKSSCVDFAKCRFVLTANDTYNNRTFTYDVSESFLTEAMVTEFRDEISISQSMTTLSTASIGEDGVINLYFNTNVANNSDELHPVTVLLLQMNSDNIFKDLTSLTMSVPSMGNSSFDLGKRISEILVTDRCYTLVCDAETGILLSPASEIDLPSTGDVPPGVLYPQSNEIDISKIAVNDKISEASEYILQQNLLEQNTDDIDSYSNFAISANDFENTGIHGSLSTLGLVNNRSIPNAAQPYAVTNVQYDDEYYEGIFKLGELMVESKVYNPSDEEVTVQLIIPSYSADNKFIGLQISETIVPPYFNENVGYTQTVNEEYFNSCAYFFALTWDSLTTAKPYGAKLQYNKNTHYGNYSSCGYIYSPEVLSEKNIHGKVDPDGVADIITYIPDVDGTVNLICEPVIGDELIVYILDEDGNIRYQNEETFDVEGGKTYYILIGGLMDTEYTLSIN